MNVAFVIGYLLLAPLIGGLLDGADRMISARSAAAPWAVPVSALL